MLVTSSATRQGLDELARELLRRVPVAEPVGARGRRRGRGGRVPGLPPGGARAFEVERVGAGRVPRHRRGGRPADRAPRHRERGGARARRAPAAPDGRDRGAGGARASSRATTSRSAASSSSSTRPSAPHAADAVGGVQRGDLVGLRERRVVEDRGDEEVESARSLRHHRLPDVDQLGRAGADHVHAEHAPSSGRRAA